MNDDRGVLREVEVSTGVDGALRGKLTQPAGPVRGGVVPLHSAGHGSPDHFLVRQLALILPPLGIAVLTYDRRRGPGGEDAPLPEQAEDALAAADLIRSHCGPVPVGLWGFGHGGWAAPLAAAQAGRDVDFPGRDVAFLVLVSTSGVSPAAQMRYYTAELARRAGYGDEAVAELLELRTGYERYQRGELDRLGLQRAIDAVADRPWFDLARVDRRPAPAADWRDMDFDPAEAFRTIRCPILLFYGEDDETVPTKESIEAWRRIALDAGGEGVSIVRLPVGTTHLPTTGPENTIDAICPEYTRELASWLTARLVAATPFGANRTRSGAGPRNATDSLAGNAIEAAVEPSIEPAAGAMAGLGAEPGSESESESASASATESDRVSEF